MKLRKEKRLHLPNLFEAGKSIPSSTEKIPSIVKSPNRSLENLSGNLFQMGIFFLSFREVVLLLVIARKRVVRFHNILFFDATPIYWAFSGSQPILQFSQGMVVNIPTNPQPFQQFLFLLPVWIKPIGVVHRQSHTTYYTTRLRKW